MAAEGGHVGFGNGSNVEIDKKTGSGNQVDDLQKKLNELMDENGELAEEMETLAREVCRLRREKDLSLREEERLNLEVAFLEEEKEYYQHQVEDTRKILFDLKQELEEAVAESTKYKVIGNEEQGKASTDGAPKLSRNQVNFQKSHLVLSEIDRSEEIDGYLKEIAQLTDDKSHVARMIKYGLPLKLGNLRHSLVRTEEYLSQKADNKRLRSELNTASARILAQDTYIDELERSIQELAQMLCRFHPMPTPASIVAAAAASGSASSVSSDIADNGFHLQNRSQNFPNNRRDLVRRQDVTQFD